MDEIPLPKEILNDLECNPERDKEVLTSILEYQLASGAGGTTLGIPIAVFGTTMSGFSFVNSVSSWVQIR